MQALASPETGHRRPIGVFLRLLLSAMISTTLATAQTPDPQALQQRGYQKIQQYLERLRNSFSPAESTAVLAEAGHDLKRAPPASFSPAIYPARQSAHTVTATRCGSWEK